MKPDRAAVRAHARASGTVYASRVWNAFPRNGAVGTRSRLIRVKHVRWSSPVYRLRR